MDSRLQKGTVLSGVRNCLDVFNVYVDKFVEAMWESFFKADLRILMIMFQFCNP